MSSQKIQGQPPSLAHYLQQQAAETQPSGSFEAVGSSGVSDVRGAWDERKDELGWPGPSGENQEALNALAELSGPPETQAHSPNPDQQAYNPESAYNPTSAKPRTTSRPKASTSTLTPAEKKAKHVQAEQKRRASIRFGYELLCNEVTELREALLIAGHGRGGSGPGGGGALAGRKPAQRKKKDDVPVVDEHGTRIDGRQGPRSESVILQKTVDHTRALQRKRKGLQMELARLRAQSGKPVEPNGWEGSWDMSQVIIDEDEDA